MKILLNTFFVLFLSVSCYAQDKTCSCCSEKHAEFDFWIGTWVVYTPEGKVAGRNVIDKIQDNCVIRESWASASGNYTGTSNNFYNAYTKQWEQLWIDNNGGSLHLKGHKTNNQMILKTDVSRNQEGKPFYHRVTWTLNDDNSVRQYWETITDDKDITVAFDGVYIRE